RDSGIVVELEDEIEGYIKANELSQERGQREPTKGFSVGDEITAQVTGFDKKKRQVLLSKRKYDEWQEKERVSNFLSSQGEPGVKLGDVLKEKLKQMNNDEVI
ncbi:MAG TPA: S1 RNA-binding domain-containing protein, partial [Thermodesulfobacteriota bacterium]|nr:S1 RNA-binding domain-containing protein [Thermodesulfobacteriota bacterium]